MAARRVSLPSADDLFRPTKDQPAPVRAVPASSAAAEEEPGTAASEPTGRAAQGRSTARKPSGRVRHDEKMTVYVTSEELLELEHARLALRSRHGMAVDRGRLVREAVAIVLADQEANGEQSALVRRLADG